MPYPVSVTQQRLEAEALGASVQCETALHLTCTGRYVVWIVTTLPDRASTGYESSWPCRCDCHEPAPAKVQEVTA